MKLRNGTKIEIKPNGSCVVLPCGLVVEGQPHDTESYCATARELGYGDDILAMCREHDPLHALLCAWLGLPSSYSLRYAAGDLDHADRHLADVEEAAVMAVQRFMRMAGGRLPDGKETCRA